MLDSIRRHYVISLWVLMALLSRIYIAFFGVSPASSFQTFQSSSGALRYQLKSGSGIPLILIPGLASFREQGKTWLHEKNAPPVFLFDVTSAGGRTAISGKSLETYAGAIHEFLTAQRIDSVHLVSHGSLSGIALELYRLQPDRVRSISFSGASLLDAYSLLGDYRFNKAVYSALRYASYIVDWAVPHFGFIPANRWVSGLSTLESSDQRINRKTLASIHVPVLFVHNVNDAAAPFSGTVAYHRLVPSAVMQTRETTAFQTLFEKEADASVTPVLRFVQTVEQNSFVPDTERASVEIPFKPYGLGIILIFVFIVLATFITEDITCFFAGILAASGTISFSFAVSACLTGLVIGDFGLYLLGRLGRRVLKKKPFSLLIPEERLSESGGWIRKNGPKVIFMSRFTPGMRTITYVSAGLLKAPALSFLFYFLLAALAWTPILVGISMVAGWQMLPYFTWVEKHLLISLAGIWLLIWFLKTWIFPLFTWKGRRLVLSKWKRLTMWEFWPSGLFNVLTVLHWFYQGIRFRSLGVFSAVNPAIPHSGFVGESKCQILDQIGAREVLGAYRMILNTLPIEEQVDQFKQFKAQNGFEYPLVFKPDVGQKGAGVEIVRSDEHARAFLAAAKEPTIVQEFLPGEEFGVFYIRLPWQETGFIYSLTEKKFTSVTGDGVSKLEQLILNDRRTVCIAASMLKRHQHQLDRVPEKGEVVKLTELGNHYRGALFLDGKRLITPELTARMDAISKTFPGFYFGRYDVRVPSESDLKAGKNIRVLELNGITSEPTHIYEPGYPLWKGYKYIFGAWRYAFQIGHYNWKQGASYTGAAELIRLWIVFLATPSK